MQIARHLLEGESPRAEFPPYLYARFCFCLAALYLARTGGGVSEAGVFGGDSSTGRGPQARPTARTADKVESQTESQTKGVGSYPYPTPTLQTILILLRSTPSEAQEANTDALCMHAVARWTILRSLVVEMGCLPAEAWISVNDLPEWNAGVVESVRIGFEADVRAGAEVLDGCALWKDARGQCEILSELSLSL
jgi:hypothetical protein